MLAMLTNGYTTYSLYVHRNFFRGTFKSAIYNPILHTMANICTDVHLDTSSMETWHFLFCIAVTWSLSISRVVCSVPTHRVISHFLFKQPQVWCGVSFGQFGMNFAKHVFMLPYYRANNGLPCHLLSTTIELILGTTPHHFYMERKVALLLPLTAYHNSTQETYPSSSQCNTMHS